LCKRYEVDASKRDVHGALIDADLLARVYLAMTGGQTALSLDEDVETAAQNAQASVAARRAGDLELIVIKATDEELAAHDALVEKMRQTV
jgi:DNA polymerase-3 subunit epsilon